MRGIPAMRGPARTMGSSQCLKTAAAFCSRRATAKAPAQVAVHATASQIGAAPDSVYTAIAPATGGAIAVAETRGAAEGLALLDALELDAALAARLAEYQPYWAARAALLARTGSAAAARDAYQRAIGLESDPAVRRFLQQRSAQLGTA